MARQRRAEREPENVPSSALYDRIVAQLKPDREITAGEFLKRAFTFPQIERVKIQKFSGGTWNFAEDVDNVGPAFNPDAIEAYLKEKYGPWRYRFLVIVGGEIITVHLLNLDGWQENEARSTLTLPARPTLTGQSKAIGPGATSELLDAAKQRIEIENTTRLLHGLEGEKPTAVTQELGLAKMMSEFMTGMMTMQRELMTMARGGMSKPEEDRFLNYLQSEIQFLREQSRQPKAERDPDAIAKTFERVDDFLKKVLDTSLAEMVSGTPKTEATGWAATIQGIIEGAKPYLPELFAGIRMAVQGAASGVSQRPPGRGPAEVIPLPVRVPPPAPVPTEEDMAKQQLDPALIEVVNMLVDALKSKNHKTVDAILMNPPLQGRVLIDPEVPAAVYATLYKNVDPRFGEMQPEIRAYQEYILREANKEE